MTDARTRIQQLLVLHLRIAAIGQQRPTGQQVELLAQQALFVKTIAQAFFDLGRVNAQLVQQVIGAELALIVGKGRVGFDQIVLIR